MRGPPATHRPTLVEWGLLLSGLATFSGLGLFFAKILPDNPEILDDTRVSYALSTPTTWVVMLGGSLVGLFAGLATRAAKGSPRATYYLALANAVLFATALTVFWRLRGGGA